MSEVRKVRIALIQQAGLAEDPAANLRALLDAIDRAAEGGVDLVVATELALTPYFGGCRDRDFRAWAEKIPGPATEAAGASARRHRATIVLPLYAIEDEVGVDIAVVLGPDGMPMPGTCADGSRVPYFTKVHLPKMETEDVRLDEPRHFRPGDALPVFETPVGPLGLLICYDRRFPEAWRALALAGAKIVAVPSCVPAWRPAADASTGDMFVAELRTRACENLLWVAACNRAGVERLGTTDTHFIGRSCVIAPGGRTVALAPADEAAIVRCEIDLGEVEAARRRLPIFRDLRPDVYSGSGRAAAARSARSER